MSTVIRVYPQPGSIGARRNRARRVAQQRAVQQQWLQQQLLAQQQAQVQQQFSVQQSPWGGVAAAWGTPIGGAWSSAAGGLGGAGCQSPGAVQPLTGALAGTSWLGSPAYAQPAPFGSRFGSFGGFGAAQFAGAGLGWGAW